MSEQGGRDEAIQHDVHDGGRRTLEGDVVADRGPGVPAPHPSGVNPSVSSASGDLAHRIIASYRTKLFKMAGRSGPVGFDAIEQAVSEAVREEVAADRASDEPVIPRFRLECGCGQVHHVWVENGLWRSEGEPAAESSPDASRSELRRKAVLSGECGHQETRIGTDGIRYCVICNADLLADDKTAEPQIGQRRRDEKGVLREWSGKTFGWVPVSDDDASLNPAGSLINGPSPLTTPAVDASAEPKPKLCWDRCYKPHGTVFRYCNQPMDHPGPHTDGKASWSAGHDDASAQTVRPADSATATPCQCWAVVNAGLDRRAFIVGKWVSKTMGTKERNFNVPELLAELDAAPDGTTTTASEGV